MKSGKLVDFFKRKKFGGVSGTLSLLDLDSWHPCRSALFPPIYLIIFYPEGCLLLCNRIPKGKMKPELNPTQAIYPPEGPKSKVCVTTTIE